MATTLSKIAKDAKKGDKELNKKLGLVIPSNTLTEYVQEWNKLFALIRYAFRAELVNEEQAKELVAIFKNVPPANYPAAINEIFLEISNNEELQNNLKYFRTSEKMFDEITEIMENLPEDIKAKAYMDLFDIDISEQDDVNIQEAFDTSYKDPLLVLQEIQNSDFLQPMSKEKVANIIRKGENARNTKGLKSLKGSSNTIQPIKDPDTTI